MNISNLLLIEGNTAAIRSKQIAAGVKTYSESYKTVLQSLSSATITVCQAADDESELPNITQLTQYDGVVMTGSWLNIYDGGSAIERQIELMRRIFASGTPFFGSCWGLQVATVAAGGTVRRNPKGREIGISSPIKRTAAGQQHALLQGKPNPFRAITVHLDEVDTLAPNTTVLASNEWTAVQAAEIRHGAGIAWAVQYHPELSFMDIAHITRRYTPSLIEQGIFKDTLAVQHYATQLEGYDAEIFSQDVDPSVLNRQQRQLELQNWLDHLVMPTLHQRRRS